MFHIYQEITLFLSSLSLVINYEMYANIFLWNQVLKDIRNCIELADQVPQDWCLEHWKQVVDSLGDPQEPVGPGMEYTSHWVSSSKLIHSWKFFYFCLHSWHMESISYYLEDWVQKAAENVRMYGISGTSCSFCLLWHSNLRRYSVSGISCSLIF